MKERLMLVTLNLHQWYPRKYDRKASEEVAKAHGAARAEEVGRFNKILVEAASIKPLQQAISKLRNRSYEMTAPWSDAGTRVLPADIYFEYVDMVNEARIEIDRLADEFAHGEYERQREQARTRLNGLFRAEDYPPAWDVRSRFGVDVKFEPLPNPEDARIWGIGDRAAEEIAERIQADAQATAQRAQDHVVEQVVTRAREFIEKVQAYDKGDSKRLYGTAVENLQDVVGLVLKGLNISGDPELAKMARDLTDAISDTDVERLKAGEGERKARVEKVQEVLDRFDGVFA